MEGLSSQLSYFRFVHFSIWNSKFSLSLSKKRPIVLKFDGKLIGTLVQVGLRETLHITLGEKERE